MPDATFTEQLLDWFERYKRDLPWRRPAAGGGRDPYRVWVAETMLQQTQVAKVIGYFDSFLEIFPSLQHLAQANLDQVLKAWEGLGYYARARNLHRAARQVLREYNGLLPADRAALLALPGIGPYTAGAILSLAFGLDEIALEANSKRVLARLLAIREPLGRPAVHNTLEQAARRLLPAGRAGLFNEALMEFGALVCTPRKPACSHCSAAGICLAQRRNLVGDIPHRRQKRAVPYYDVTAAVIWEDGRLLLTQRPRDAMLGGLWEFPGGKCEGGESLPSCLQREIREELGMGIQVMEQIISVPHAYSHMRITLHAFRCLPADGWPQAIGVQDWRWVRLSELENYALSTADRRIADELLRRAGGESWSGPGG